MADETGTILLNESGLVPNSSNKPGPSTILLNESGLVPNSSNKPNGPSVTIMSLNPDIWHIIAVKLGPFGVRRLARAAVGTIMFPTLCDRVLWKMFYNYHFDPRIKHVMDQSVPMATLYWTKFKEAYSQFIPFEQCHHVSKREKHCHLTCYYNFIYDLVFEFPMYNNTITSVYPYDWFRKYQHGLFNADKESINNPEYTFPDGLFYLSSYRIVLIALLNPNSIINTINVNEEMLKIEMINYVEYLVDIIRHQKSILSLKTKNKFMSILMYILNKFTDLRFCDVLKLKECPEFVINNIIACIGMDEFITRQVTSALIRNIKHRKNRTILIEKVLGLYLDTCNKNDILTHDWTLYHTYIWYILGKGSFYMHSDEYNKFLDMFRNMINSIDEYMLFPREISIFDREGDLVSIMSISLLSFVDKLDLLNVLPSTICTIKGIIQGIIQDRIEISDELEAILNAPVNIIRVLGFENAKVYNRLTYNNEPHFTYSSSEVYYITEDITDAIDPVTCSFTGDDSSGIYRIV
jgi:hypothetical protein